MFDENYDLMKLEKLKVFIKENGHLPNIPSSEEAIQNGVELTDINVKLLEKVEELTLYTLEQDEKLRQQNDLLQSLKLRIEKIENK